MKKIFTLIAAVLTMSFAQAQVVTVDFEGESWTKLIDNPQYGGPLIYSSAEYKWQDEKTSLSSTCEKADWTAWGMGYGWDHGIAISNYVDATAANYDLQLAVPVSNGSDNFAVVWDNNSELAFADGKAHTILSMDVINTAYPLSKIKKALGEGYFFKVVATGYMGNEVTNTMDIMLAEGDNAIENWTNVNLSALGAVTKVVFTFDGSDKGDYGVNTPKYFALDNVKVDLTDALIVDFEATSWDALIDNPQYGGPLIYSSAEYKWQDEKTSLSSTCEKADWTAWGMGYGWDHGIAISNYVDATASSYDLQLAVPVSNGSKNFAVVWDNNSELAFADGKGHTILSMDVINTAYPLSQIKKALGEGYFFKAVATGYMGDEVTNTVDIMLAEGDNAIENWTNVDLSALGAVTKVVFTFDGSDKGDYGVNTPKYFAFDNVKVSKEVVTGIKEVVTAPSHADARPVAYYSINGKRISTPQKGVNIVRMSDGSSRKIIVR